VQWTRRERLSLPMHDRAGVQLGEEQEIYVVEIYSGTTLKRTVRNPNTEIVEKPYWGSLYDPNGLILYLS